MRVAVTGHRPPQLGGYHYAAERQLVHFATQMLRDLGPSEVITGMAQGWDQAIAEACVALAIPYTAAIPFRGQEYGWPLAAQDRYKELCKSAHKEHLVAYGNYTARKLLDRNAWMVDNADRVLALWNGDTSGGTAHCVRYAEEQNKTIVNVWDEWVQYRAE